MSRLIQLAPVVVLELHVHDPGLTTPLLRGEHLDRLGRASLCRNPQRRTTLIVGHLQVGVTLYQAREDGHVAGQAGRHGRRATQGSWTKFARIRSRSGSVELALHSKIAF